jgi:hypothetical protein
METDQAAPIMSADALARVRLGLRMAFALASCRGRHAYAAAGRRPRSSAAAEIGPAPIRRKTPAAPRHQRPGPGCRYGRQAGEQCGHAQHDRAAPTGIRC